MYFFGCQQYSIQYCCYEMKPKEDATVVPQQCDITVLKQCHIYRNSQILMMLTAEGKWWTSCDLLLESKQVFWVPLWEFSSGLHLTMHLFFSLSLPRRWIYRSHDIYFAKGQKEIRLILSFYCLFQRYFNNMARLYIYKKNVGWVKPDQVAWTIT